LLKFCLVNGNLLLDGSLELGSLLGPRVSQDLGVSIDLLFDSGDQFTQVLSQIFDDLSKLLSDGRGDLLQICGSELFELYYCLRSKVQVDILVNFVRNPGHCKCHSIGQLLLLLYCD